MSLGLLLSVVFAIPGDPVIDLPPTEPFEAPKYGVATRLPKDWPLAVREKEDRVFVAVIPQDDPNRPGIAACELGLVPESLEEYRTRIDSSAEQRGRQNGKLASNRVIKDASGERLETIWEFHPSSGGFWREVTVRVVAHRQLYSSNYTKEGLGNFFREAVEAAGIPVTKKGSKQKGYSGHGLRKASATIAAESGATEAELNAMFGWSGHQMAQLYTRRADRQRLAARAMAKWARPSSDDVVGEAELTHLMLEKERG